MNYLWLFIRCCVKSVCRLASNYWDSMFCNRLVCQPWWRYCKIRKSVVSLHRRTYHVSVNPSVLNRAAKWCICHFTRTWRLRYVCSVWWLFSASSLTFSSEMPLYKGEVTCERFWKSLTYPSRHLSHDTQASWNGIGSSDCYLCIRGCEGSWEG